MNSTFKQDLFSIALGFGLVAVGYISLTAYWGF